MKEFLILILMAFFASNSQDKAESVKLEETPLKTFDEIFGEGWWDKGEAEDLKTPAPTNFGQNVHHQIDRQNTQIGQIEPNSTDQNPPLTESDHSGQFEPNSADQIAEDDKKRKIIDIFHAMKDEFKQKGNYSKKEWVKIEEKIAKNLKASRTKIYKWKKEFGLAQRNPKNERINLIEKFDQKKAELMRTGIKNSYSNQIDAIVAKELGLSFATIYKWKRELGQTAQRKHFHGEQKDSMKRYYEIKYQNPKIIDKEIAKMLKIGTNTLIRRKKQFKRQQFHSNSVDGYSVEVNASGSNVQEIGNSNPRSI